MSSRTRNYIQNGPMWRGVNVRQVRHWNEETREYEPTGETYIRYTGPYDTPGKAKASVDTEGGYIERAEPVWEREGEWVRERR